MTGGGRRDRKRARLRAHISDVATALFAAHGFDAVSVTQIADAADVARPTVFAHFPRKEDLVFDRLGAVTADLVGAVERSTDPIDAVMRLLMRPVPPAADTGAPDEQLAFWRLVAGSRPLRARARELAAELEAAAAAALSRRAVPEPELCAALIAAAYRTVHLAAIGRLLAGEPADTVCADRADRLRTAFDAVRTATDQLAAAAGGSVTAAGPTG